MPTYQYRCTACGEPLEVVQSFTDDPLTECPSCGGQLRKVFSSVGIVFKGSGFYRTDSRGDGGEKKPVAASSDSKVDAKSESKSDKSTSEKGPEKKSEPTKSDSSGDGKKDSSTSTSSAA